MKPPPTTQRLAAIAAAMLALGTADAEAPTAVPPPVKLAWLWDGADAPADPETQAAVVVQQLLLTGDELRVRPRPRAPALAPRTPVTPVVHVEISTVRPPADPARYQHAIVHAVVQAAQLSNSGWVQLDMETRASQRAFHRAVIAELRRALPRDIRLSVTALAWWCRDPTWLDGLAADEVVPMFFRMGRDTPALRGIVASEPQRLAPLCRSGAAGFSVQEPFHHETIARYRKTYWFDNHRWQQELAP